MLIPGHPTYPRWGLTVAQAAWCDLPAHCILLLYATCWSLLSPLLSSETVGFRPTFLPVPQPCLPRGWSQCRHSTCSHLRLVSSSRPFPSSAALNLCGHRGRSQAASQDGPVTRNAVTVHPNPPQDAWLSLWYLSC